MTTTQFTAVTDRDQPYVDTIRMLSIDAAQQANSGHPGTSMALAPIGYVLFTPIMRHSPRDPDWPDAIASCSARATRRCCSTRFCISRATGWHSTSCGAFASALILSPQGIPSWNPAAVPRDAIERGAYVLRGSYREPKLPELILIATGNGVHICARAADLLEADGIATRVVSTPCLENFAAQDRAYRDAVLRRATSTGTLASRRSVSPPEVEQRCVACRRRSGRDEQHSHRGQTPVCWRTVAEDSRSPARARCAVRSPSAVRAHTERVSGLRQGG
jgi:hypothetical protein